MSFGRISFILWRTTNRNRLLRASSVPKEGATEMDRPPGLRHGDQIYFPVIEQDDGRCTHSVASL